MFNKVNTKSFIDPISYLMCVVELKKIKTSTRTKKKTKGKTSILLQNIEHDELKIKVHLILLIFFSISNKEKFKILFYLLLTIYNK